MGFTKAIYTMKPPVTINFDFGQTVGDGAMNGTGKNDGTQPGNSPAGGAPAAKY